jgi:hypothetical protein
MKTFGVFTFGMLFVVGLLSPLSAEPQFGRDRGRQNQGTVCVYKDIHYQGTEQCFRSGDTISTLQGLNGQISSIRINGRESVTVYDETNFRGHMTTFTSSMPDLGQVRLESKSWSDRIQSLQISTGDGRYGSNAPYGNGSPYPNTYPNTYPNQRISDGVCVYDRPNYQGRSQCWSAGEQLSDLGRNGNWNDRIASIRVFGRATAIVYRNTGFGGPSMVVNRDIPDLSRNWDRQISSLRIEDVRGNNGRGWARGRQQRY